MRGQRQQKQGGTKQKLKDIQTAIANLQMGQKIAQMFGQQQSQQIVRLDNDYQKVFHVAQNLDYRTRALLEVLDVDTDKLESIAEKYRLEDFNQQSDDEDKAKGNINDDAGEVTENSIVILTSEAEKKEQSIFRVKFGIQDIPHLKELKEDLLGKKVGDKFKSKFNGAEHEFEVLGLRLPPEPKESDKVKEDTVEKAELNVVPDHIEKPTGEGYENTEEKND